MWHRTFVIVYMITLAVTLCCGIRSHNNDTKQRKQRKNEDKYSDIHKRKGDNFNIRIHLHLYNETGKELHKHHVRGRVLTVTNVTVTKHEPNITFTSIMNASVDAITHIADTDKIKHYLNTYYFTMNDEYSIWARAVKERGIHFYKHRTKFESMQSVIKALYVRWLNCGNFTDCEEQCQCYFSMHDLLVDGKSEFALPSDDIVSQAILFDLHVAYNVMSLLIYHLTIHTAIFARRPANVIRVAYLQIAEDLHRDIGDTIRNITMARLQKISDIEICNLEEILWMDYTGLCQCYDNNVYGLSNITKKSPETYYSITGNTSLPMKRFHARVIDRANGTVVCNEYRESAGGDEHSVEIEIYKTCHYLRNKYVTMVRREFRKLHRDRTLKIREDLSTLWGRQRKKVKKKKDLPAIFTTNLT